jgi:hypothetical protein
MSAPQSVPASTASTGFDSGEPNQYHLHSESGVQISYYPGGAGPLTVESAVILSYNDGTRSLTFRGKQARVVHVPDLGTCVSVTIETTIDTGSATATILIPTVVLPPGQSTEIETDLIATVHDLFLSGLGRPQRDHYTVVALTGEASYGPLPL